MGWGSCNQQLQALEQHPTPTAGFYIWAVADMIQHRPEDPPPIWPPLHKDLGISTVPHTYLECTTAEEHEQGLVSLHPLQEEQGWLPEVIYAGQVTSL